MTDILRFSPSRLAIVYVALSVLVLGLFAVPLWYKWGVNIATFKAYVEARDVDALAGALRDRGPEGLIASVAERARGLPRDEILVLADATRSRLAGNLPAWPAEVPEAPGTYGLVIGADGDAPMRVVASHVLLPGGYRLLAGRESVRFQSLVDYFWYGIAGALAIALVVAGLVGWLVRRALLFEVREISRNAQAIVEGDLSRRLPARRSANALDHLARTVNGLLERLADRNAAELARANASLRESETRFALAVDASGDGFTDWIVATDDFYASPRLKEMCGMSADTRFRGRADFLRQFPFHPDDRERVIGAIDAHFAAGTIRLDQEMRIVHGGQTRWLHLTGLCSRAASGTLTRWTAALTDVTERKRAEQSLAQSETRYARAMEAAEEGHWEWNIPADEMFLSDRMKEMLGFPPDATFASRAEFLDRQPIPPEDRQRLNEIRERTLAGDTNRYEIEYRVFPRPGDLHWVRSRGKVFRDPAGRPVCVTGSLSDVTERRVATEALRARQDLLDLAQKAARAVAFEWRIGAAPGDNRWSPELEAMYGLARGTYDGTYEAWKALVHPDDWPGVRAAIKAAQATGEVDAEYRVTGRDGAMRCLQSKGRMLFDDAGNPARVVGFMLDVTDRHRAVSELRRMEAQLRQAQRLEAMGTMAGGIAHDFNNLLGAILGYGEMALRDAPAGTRLRRDIDSIIVAGERGRALVDRILAFSRSGVGERVAVDVQAVARETLRIVGSGLPAGIVVRDELRAKGAAVTSDATQIHQVLMNLVTNAVQAMPAGGELRVALDTVAVDAPRMTSTGPVASGAYVVLEIADTGTGIAPGIVERIFDPFFTTKDVGVGTGLGLSLVHGIVIALGGAVDVASPPGRGSTFRVYLPRAAETTGTARMRKRLERAAGRGHRQRVLVVDDEEALVTLTTERLVDLGYTPIGFTSAVAALGALRADPDRFDALITDESMPGTSGSELVRQARALRPTLPVVLVSGYLSPEVARRAQEAGADEVLKKPVSTRDLAHALERALGAQRKAAHDA